MRVKMKKTAASLFADADYATERVTCLLCETGEAGSDYFGKYKFINRKGCS